MKKNILQKKKIKLQIILCVLILLLPILMVSRFSVAQPYVKNPDSLIIAKLYEPSTFEPTWAWDSISIEQMSSCYDTLIAFEREKVDSFVPRIATEVPSIENGGISLDGLTYRFHIRSGVYFANGFPLTPEDVEYTFERAMVRDPEWGPIGYYLAEPLLGVSSTRDSEGKIIVKFSDIDQVVEVEGNDVVFHLVKPYSLFMQILTLWFSSIVSKQWCSDHGDWGGSNSQWKKYNNVPSSPLDRETMGTGPFILESWTPAEVVLVRNDLYWRGPAKLNEIVFKKVNNFNTGVQMLIEGDVDFTFVPTYYYSDLEGVAGIRQYQDLNVLSVTTACMNFEISELSPYIGSGLLDGYGIPPNFFSDIDIRKAFAYAFDYDTFINEMYLGEALQPATCVIEGLPFHNPDQSKYSLDLIQAEEHFRQAWGGQVWDTGFKLTLAYPASNMFYKALAEILKANIEGINQQFHIELQGISWYEYLIGMQTGQLPIDFVGWGADYPDPHDFVYPFMHSSVSFSRGYNNPLVDNLIEDGVMTLDPAERRVIYYELQSIYHEEVPGIPIAQPLTRHYERDWVQGWYYNPFWAIPDFYSIWKALPADVSIEPETLNIKNNGKWISLYIELPYGIHPDEIDLATVSLVCNEKSQTAVIDPKYDFVWDSNIFIVDHDEDGVLERLVKIDRALVVSDLNLIDFDQDTGLREEIEMIVEGNLYDGTPFAARLTVIILK
jgi:peptide/nickel transport system substrate-binding protein